MMMMVMMMLRRRHVLHLAGVGGAAGRARGVATHGDVHPDRCTRTTIQLGRHCATNRHVRGSGHLLPLVERFQQNPLDSYPPRRDCPSRGQLRDATFYLCSSSLSSILSLPWNLFFWLYTPGLDESTENDLTKFEGQFAKPNWTDSKDRRKNGPLSNH